MKKTLQILGFWFLSVSSLQGAGWVFATEEEAKEAFGENEEIATAEIADFSYDQPFKKLMSAEGEYVEYLMDFLNSIYFPDAEENGLKIREIASVNTELTNFEEKENSNKGSYLCDVACKCICFEANNKENTVQIFTVEMQRAPQSFFLDRLWDYGIGLYNKFQIKVKALGLLNFYSSAKRVKIENKTRGFAMCEIDQKTGQPILLSDTDKRKFIELNMIELRGINDGDEFFIKGKKLGDQAITWLKLFGIKQWNTRDPETKKYRIYYPKNKIDPVIQRAINLISNIKQSQVEQWVRGEAAKDDALFTSRKEGREEGRQECQKDIILNMSNRGMDPSIIAECLGLSEEKVNEILSERPSKRARTEEE